MAYAMLFDHLLSSVAEGLMHRSIFEIHSAFPGHGILPSQFRNAVALAKAGWRSTGPMGETLSIDERYRLGGGSTASRPTIQRKAIENASAVSKTGPFTFRPL